MEAVLGVQFPIGSWLLCGAMARYYSHVHEQDKFESTGV